MNTLPHTYVERNRNHPLAFIVVVVALKGEKPVCVCVCGCVFLPPRFFVLPGKSSIFRTLIVPKEKKELPTTQMELRGIHLPQNHFQRKNVKRAEI